MKITYTLEYLESVRNTKALRSDCKIKSLDKYNNLIALFPVKIPELSTINNTWRFMCLCGNFCVKDAGSVARGTNKSCGCLRTNGSSYWKSRLNLYLRALVERPDLTLTQFPEEGNKRSCGFRCNVCAIEKTNLDSYEVLQQKRKFCRCSDSYICNRVEALQEFKTKIMDFTWELSNFPDEFINKKGCRVDLVCKVCDAPKNMSYENAVRGKGCFNCANIATSKRLSRDLDWFIEESNLVHQYKYDYSKSMYNGARTKLDIICHEHDTPFKFPQSPDNHKNKGKGCPECKRLRLQYVSFHKAKVEENKEMYKKLNSGVYLFKVGDFHKIGLSCNDHKRSLEVKKSSKLDTAILGYLPCNLYEAFFLENFLHKRYEDYRHYSKTAWEGHSECFDLTHEQVTEVLVLLGGRDDNNTK